MRLHSRLHSAVKQRPCLSQRSGRTDAELVPLPAANGESQKTRGPADANIGKHPIAGLGFRRCRRRERHAGNEALTLSMWKLAALRTHAASSTAQHFPPFLNLMQASTSRAPRSFWVEGKNKNSKLRHCCACCSCSAHVMLALWLENCLRSRLHSVLFELLVWLVSRVLLG